MFPYQCEFLQKMHYEKLSEAFLFEPTWIWFHFLNDLLGNEWLLEQNESFSLSTLETSKINFLFLLFDDFGEDFFAADGVIGDATEFDNAFKCTLVAIIITFMLFLYASWINKLKFWRLFSKECINSDSWMILPRMDPCRTRKNEKIVTIK